MLCIFYSNTLELLTSAYFSLCRPWGIKIPCLVLLLKNFNVSIFSNFVSCIIQLQAQTQNTDLKSSVVIFNPHCWKRLEVISIPGKMFEQLQNHSQDQNGIQLDKKGNILGKIFIYTVLMNIHLYCISINEYSVILYQVK